MSITTGIEFFPQSRQCTMPKFIYNPGFVAGGTVGTVFAGLPERHGMLER